MNVNYSPKNHLLSGLPKGEWSQLSGLCEYVDLELGQVLFDEGGRPRTCGRCWRELARGSAPSDGCIAC